MRFRNRRDAGCSLAEHLARTIAEQPVVIALPRGGVPVGYEVARVLGAPLDLLAVRKLAAPGEQEYAVGAISEGDALVVNEPEAERVGLTGEVRERKLAVERRELARRATAYRGVRPMIEVIGRTAIVVDDGLATGLTARAAVQALRQLGASRVIVAAPVGAADAIERLRDVADDVVVAHSAAELRAVGEFYDDFAQVQDDEVLDLLARGRAQNTGEFSAVTLRD